MHCSLDGVSYSVGGDASNIIGHVVNVGEEVDFYVGFEIPEKIPTHQRKAVPRWHLKTLSGLKIWEWPGQEVSVNAC